MKGKGFQQLRAASVMGAMGLGVLAGGTARAASKPMPVSYTAAGFKFYQVRNATNYGPNPANTGSAPAAFQLTSGSILGACGNTACTFTTSRGDWFDGGLEVAVDGVMFTNPTGSVDLTGNVMTSGTAPVSGVDVQVKMTFGVGRPGVVRALYSFTNHGTTSVTKSVAIGGNMGSDGNTTVQASASGDTVADSSDGWWITDDNTTVGGDSYGDPITTLSFFGQGAAVTPVLTKAPGVGSQDLFAETYSLTIPAGSTRSILVFAEMTERLATAKANASTYDSSLTLAADGFLNGLSLAEKSQIVNFNGAGTVFSHAPATGGNGAGAMDPASLLGLGGLFGFLRLRRRRTPQA